MHDIAHRLALGLLVSAAALALLLAALAASEPGGAVVHRHWLLLALGVVLAAAVAVPAWRLPTIAAALLAEAADGVALALAGTPPPPDLLLLGPVQLLALAAAGAIWLHQARFEARWDGVLPLRQEG